MINNELMLSVRSENSFKVSFKNKFSSSFIQPKTNKVALLVTSEYEGIFKNGGIGTYYKTLSQKLSQDGWYVILLICCSDDKFQGKSNIADVKHIFSIGEIQEVLNLQPIHSAILSPAQYNAIDYTSYCCLFFTQAVANSFKNSLIYVEFHEYGGIGYRTIQAKQSTILPANCITAVTMHSGHEWLFEANERYTENDPHWFWQICHYEQYSFENADLAFFPSYYLKSKVESYGWNTSHALHLPYFVPIIKEIENNKHISIHLQDNFNSEIIPIVFFGRLEERKGLCIFIEALKLLDSSLKSQIHIYFVGKVVQLQSSSLKHLNSLEYIQQQLETEFSFNILSEFYSKEAIEFVNKLDNPIVCLTSSQENFPNSALEMGQLPVSLIVSDTGGFRETLQLINRSVGIYWFKPKDSKSLYRVIDKVIYTHTKNIANSEVPHQPSLVEINEELRIRKIKYIEELFFKSSPKTYTEPKVTVGVTCYNLGKYLLDCLNSLDVQTYQNLEVIVLDDASTDEHTQEVINQAQFMFPNFKFINSNINMGLGAARNYLIELAQGEYFIPFDADNIALPFMVEKFVKAAIESNAAIVSSPLMCFGTQMISVEPATFIHSFTGGLLPAMLKENCCGDAGSLFSLKLLRKFKHPEDRDVVTHDWHLMVATSVIGEKIVYYAYPVYLYRLRPDSMISLHQNPSRDQYQLRQYLSQLEPSQFSHRQIYFLITATQQLLQSKDRWQSQTQAELVGVQLEDGWQSHTQIELEQAKSRIAAMESSKFWQLRSAWFKLKKKIGLPIDD